MYSVKSLSLGRSVSLKELQECLKNFKPLVSGKPVVTERYVKIFINVCVNFF
jgi:hypothetical protein